MKRAIRAARHRLHRTGALAAPRHRVRGRHHRGLPDRTEEAFVASRDLVAACGLTHLHVFPYSQRAGTPAARMPQVPHPLRKARAALLRQDGAAALRRHLDGEIGARAACSPKPTTSAHRAVHPVRLAAPARRARCSR